MEIPEENLPEDAVEAVRRLHPTRRRSEAPGTRRIQHEVLVVFRDVATRDMIFSYASNLGKTNGTASQAGVRMEIPPHLTGIFKTLDSHGQLLRKRHGPGVKRSIKFDDLEMSLYMDVKLPDESSWLKVDYATAREELRFIQKEKVVADRRRFSEAGAGSHVPATPPQAIAGPLPTSATLTKYSKPWGHRLG